MAKHIKKLLIRSKIFLSVLIISAITSFLALLFFPKGNISVLYSISAVSNILFLISLYFYYIKYRLLGSCVNTLKKENIEYYMDEISLDTPTLPISKIYCSECTFFAKIPYVIVPFSHVAWAKELNIEQYRIYLKNGKSFVLKLGRKEKDTFFGYVRHANPSFIQNTSRDMEKEYYRKYPEALKHKKHVRTIWGIVLIAVAFLFFLITYFNHTIATNNLCFEAVLIIAGTILMVSGKEYLNLKNIQSNILKKIHASVIVDILSKIFTALCGISMAAIIVTALIYSKTRNPAFNMLFNGFTATFLASVVPSVASIFLKIGFFIPIESRNFMLPKEDLDELSYIYDFTGSDANIYSFMLTFAMDWDYIRDSLEYLAKEDIIQIKELTVKDKLNSDITNSFLNNGKNAAKTPELQSPKSTVILSGKSKRLKLPVTVIWFISSRMLRIFLPIENRDVAERYAETILRKSFNTNDSMKKAKPIPYEERKPVSVSEQNIFFDVDELLALKYSPVAMPQYEYNFVIPLTERTPVISVYEGPVKTIRYCLQTEGDEDFTGKFFHCSVRVDTRKPLLAALIDGFVSDTAEEQKMTLNNIGYRMEAYLFRYDMKLFQETNGIMAGKDLVEKALKYPGHTTPANVRLIGICQKCNKSFAFHGYSFYMAQQDVAYSDNGQRCCTISDHDINPDTWSYEADGLKFSYYNSFCCPYCGEPYIDYKNNREMKQFGVSGCVHLGTKYYEADKT